jgi:hypothetical protein
MMALFPTTRQAKRRAAAGAPQNPKDIAGAKKAPLRYVPPALAILAAPANADGAAEYGPFNWREIPISYMTYLEAIERHVAALKDRQDIDEKSGLWHLSHIAATVGIIADAKGCGTLIDDRPIPGPAPVMLAALVKKERGAA